jgi:hypothetical protein
VVNLALVMGHLGLRGKQSTATRIRSAPGYSEMKLPLFAAMFDQFNLNRAALFDHGNVFDRDCRSRRAVFCRPLDAAVLFPA